jgi:hypothetical protein
MKGRQSAKEREMGRTFCHLLSDKLGLSEAVDAGLMA